MTSPVAQATGNRKRYVHDFGSFVIKPDRVVRATDALLINPDLWKLAWLRPIAVDELAKTGDAEKRMILGRGFAPLSGNA